MRLLIILLLLFFGSVECLTFSVPESAEIGLVIGYISGRAEVSTTPTFFVVFPDEQISKFLKVDEKSGEISTIATLDYEKRARFDFVAVRVAQNAETVDITIEVVDENDNAPKFADQHVKMKISEFAQLGATFALPTVTDGDGPNFNVHKFEILQGNVNNVFRIATRHVAGDDEQHLQADLVVNGQLDREFRDSYELLIEAQDGGRPAKTGQCRVSVAILDANDMAPIFARTRYSATVSPNITAGAKIIEIRAEDGDIGENARISYEIRKTAAPSNSLFQISETGVISATGQLLAASTHDLIVVARDHGSPSLSTSAVITITVLGTTLSAPPLDVIWLVESNSAHLMENATLGSIVARVSISQEHRDSRLKLMGCNALCPQQTDTSHVYLLLLCGVLDRETQPEYHLKFILEKGDGQIVVEHPQLLTVGDINDNWPHWYTSQIHISLNRTTAAGGSRTLTAIDADAGQNGWIKYSILDTDRVAIDAETGRVYVAREIGCDVGAELRFRVRAEDGGQPPLFNDLQVIADLVDVESRPPQFERALWQVEVAEDVPIGTCLIKVVANSSQCGSSKRIRYSMRDPKLSIDSISGTVCLIQQLDYEESKSYQATVIATNSNSETSNSLISISLKDVNDNWPIFYPNEYQLTIREGQLINTGPLLVVSATDLDEGLFGQVTYQILSDSASFAINPTTGEISGKKPLTRGKYHLVIGAKDGAGQTSEHPANVYINVIDEETNVPMFSKARYEIRTTEDILPGIAIGSVAAISDGKIKYSIYSGDPEHFFSIDENSGKIYVTRYLDADVNDRILLNIEARMDGSEMSNQTQVLIHIEDHNDNAPMFESDVLEISIREDQATNVPFYMIHAVDKDKRENGKVFYTILSSHPVNSGGIQIDQVSGQISTLKPFDYEHVRDYKLRLKAFDGGIPAKSSNITLFIHILDVNDNSPQFADGAEPTQDILEVVEMSTPKTIIGRIRATDRDSGANGDVKYRITNGSEYFGIDEKLGDVYTKRAIDREVMSFIDITIVVEDQGVPKRENSRSWRVNVLDVNDNAPSCSTITPIVVAVDAPPSMCIGTIVATDPDKGLNGSVLYRAQLESPLFVVKANGDVYLRRALNSSSTEHHHQRLSVIVSDQGTPRKSAVCHVGIQITAASQSPSSIVLFEPIERYIQIADVCAKQSCRLTYINSTGVHRWQIQSSEISNHFQLRDGVLTMLSNPTSHRPPYTLTIIMSDINGRQKSLQIRLNSKNQREETIRINDSLGIGSKVGRLGEKDGTIFYYSNSTGCPLEVDQTSGQLYLAQRVETPLQCSFEKFNTTLGTSTTLEVQIEVAKSRHSSRPKLPTDHMVISVREDVPIGSVVASMAANSSGENEEAISWRFGATMVDAKFAIDQFTGDVSVVESLHWHEKPVYNLVIEAFTRHTTSLLLTINIEDVDDHPPTIISPNTLLLPSTLRKGSIVHRVIAKDLDRDQDKSIKYSFKTPSKLLKINETSGEISIRSGEENKENSVKIIADSAGKQAEQLINIKYSTKNHSWHYFDEQKMSTSARKFDLPTSSVEHVKLTVVTPEPYDLNGLQIAVNTSNTLTILAENSEHLDYTVVQVNIPISLDFEPLKITSTSCGVVSIPENLAVLDLRRIMVQGARRPQFKFQGNVEKEFRINSTNGMISVDALDREARQEHLLVVMVEDRGRTDSCTVRIIVTDTNDNSPQFHPSTPSLLTINTSTNLGDVLFTFDATDPDISLNGKLTFDLLRDESSSLDLIPETGSLVIRRHSKLAEWVITCRVSDHGSPKRLYKDVEIKMLNLNQNPRHEQTELGFLKQSYVSSVDESLPRGQFVGKVQVVPEDVGITYSIVEGNVDSAFVIDADGVIRTNLELDKEIIDQYNLRIIGIPSSSSIAKQQISTRFDIRINNLNDNVPFFSATLPKRISESTPIGTYIATIQAKDVDQLDALQYSMDGSEVFEIDRFTGNVHLVKELDFEKVQNYELKIRATDGEFEAFTNLTIHVIDTNDNPPAFAKPIYTICTNTLIDIDVSANDPDTQTTLIYTIHPEYLASIGPGGMVRLKMLPPIGERHVAKIVVTDGKFKTAVPLVITIGGEENDTKSKAMERIEKVFRIGEDAPIGMLVGNVFGEGEEEEEEEFIGDSEDFEIDRFGRVYTKRQLTPKVFNIQSNSGKFNITIKVDDTNDNPPQFTSQIYAIALKDSMQHGQVIGKVVATDKDTNDTITYHILSGNDKNVITLGQESGNVIFNEWNDETPQRIFIEARDAAGKSDISIIVLNLKLSGATAPFFVLPNYDVHVLEDTLINTVVYRVRSSNRLGVPIQNLMYSLKETSDFAIDLMTGEIRTKIHLDWESQSLYTMQLAVADGNGRSAVVPLKIHVEPCDEFAPIFAQRQYTFQVAINTEIGESVGKVRAVDEDAGVHGVVGYSILDKQNTVRIDEGGNIILRKDLSSRKNLTVEKFDIVAYSSPHRQTTATVYLEIGQFSTLHPTIPRLLHSTTIQVASVTLLLLLVTLILLICVCMCRARSTTNAAATKHPLPPPPPAMSLQKQVYSVQTGEIRTLSSDICVVAPPPPLPKRGDTRHRFHDSMSSSTSSEVLRAKSQLDSGIDPEDGESLNSSVTDYLVSLGVNANPIPPRIRTTTTYDSLMNDYIYARVDDVLPPGPINLHTPNQHSMLRQPITIRKPPIIPSFEPLTEIFNEICDQHQKEYVQVEI